MMSLAKSPARQSGRPAGSLPPPVVFLLLLPWSVSGTFLLVTMGYFLSNAGVSIAAVAIYGSAVMIPDTFKVLWAPLVDATLGPRRWHAIGVVGTVLGLSILAFVPVTPGHLPLITGLAIACAATTTFVHLTTDIFVTYDIAPERKGRAAGWGAASNLGGGTLGGGLAIYLAGAGLPSWCPVMAVALICAASAPSVLMTAPRPPAGTAKNPITGISTLARDLLEMIRSRKGATALLLFVLPIGSVGLMNLIAPLASDWHAGAMAVAFVSGVGGGLVQIAGALAGGFFADRVDRKRAYLVAGSATAVILTGMAFAPRTPLTFVVFALAYLFALGVSFATFNAVEFEAVGGGGAAATKCMLLVCVSNLSSDLTSPLDGYIHDRFGVSAMLLGEVALGITSIGLFALVLVAVQQAERWRGRASDRVAIASSG